MMPATGSSASHIHGYNALGKRVLREDEGSGTERRIVFDAQGQTIGVVHAA